VIPAVVGREDAEQKLAAHSGVGGIARGVGAIIIPRTITRLIG